MPEVGNPRESPKQRKHIRLEHILRDPRCQPRAGLSRTAVNDYARRYRQNDKMPPVEVVWDGRAYVLWDGFHRVEAAARAKRPAVEALVQDGTLQDAILLSCRANARNGLHRSTAERRRAVARLLELPGWAQASTREIAAACEVSEPLAEAVRRAKLGPEVLEEVRQRRDGRKYVQKLRPTAAERRKQAASECGWAQDVQLDAEGRMVDDKLRDAWRHYDLTAAVRYACQQERGKLEGWDTLVRFLRGVETFSNNEAARTLAAKVLQGMRALKGGADD